MNQHFTVRNMVYIAIGAALLTVCSWLSIPFTIPFTLQTFAVCLIAALFGWKKGLGSLFIFFLLGAVGLPVFSGFKSGVAVLLGTTGGYLIGFIFTTLIVGISVSLWGRRLPVLLLSMVLGILVCYAFGTAWFMVLYTRNTGAIGLATALSWCVIPYLLPDAAKVLLAAFLTNRLYPFIKK